jgi:hypothetical protein
MLLHRKSTIMQPERPSLRQPIECAKFFKNRAGDIIVIQLKEYEGVPFLDVRQFFVDEQGVMRPSKKGVTVTVRKLPDLLAGVRKAAAKAAELGLLTDGPSDG